MRAAALALLLVACGPEAAAPLVFDSPDTQLDRGEEGVDSLSSATCAAGARLAVAWTEPTETGAGLWWTTSADGGQTWSAPQEVSGTPKTASNPAIACDGGTIAVAWEDNRDGELDLPNIWTTVTLDGGLTFSAPTRIEPDTEGRYPSSAPALAVEGAVVHAVWMDQLYGAYDIFYGVSRDGGGSWSTPLRLDGDDAGAAWSGYPTLRASQGVLAVAWEDARNGDADIYFTQSTDGGATFATPVRVDTGDEPGAADSHAVALDLDPTTGAVVLAWQDQRDGEGYSIYASTSADRVTFAGAAIRVSGALPGFFDTGVPRLACFGGVTHVVYEDNRNGDRDVWHTTLVDGVVGPESAIGQNATGQQAALPRLAVGPEGVVVAWTDTRYDPDGQNADLFYQISTDGGLTWAPEDLRLNGWAGGTTYVVDPFIGLSDGRVVATWSDGRNGDADLWFGAVTPGESTLLPDGED
jgi:hypothetical protein